LRRLRFLPLVLLAGCVLFAGSVFMLHRFGPGPSRLAECPGLVDARLRERCLRDALGELAAVSGPGAAAAALGELLAAEPASSDLRRLCHTATHDAGRGVRADVVMLRRFLAAPSAGVCEWGLAHGLLTAWLDTDPPRVDVTGLLEVCTDLGSPDGRLGCADSVGHVIWEREQEFSTAVDGCFAATHGTHAVAVSEACVSGVFMQFYRPVAPSSAPGTWSAPVSDEEIVGLCAGLAPVREPACAEASHYAFSDELRAVRDQVVDGEIEASEGFPALLTRVVEFCSGFSTDGSVRCVDASARYFLQALQGIPAADPAALVCEHVPSTRRDRCLDVAAALRLQP
jgi:hypothetical protein